jgi:hypothetical protein
VKATFIFYAILLAIPLAIVAYILLVRDTGTYEAMLPLSR